MLEVLEDRTVPSVSITSPGDQVNYDGDMVNLTVVASDSSDNPLQFDASNLPAGLEIDVVSGDIFGTISSDADTSSPYSVTVTANDSLDNNYASQTFTWTVANPVTLTNPGDQTNNDGDQVSLQMNGSDASGGALSYNFSGLPRGLTGDQATGLISGTIASDADQYGPYTVTVSAVDQLHQEQASRTFTWTVAATSWSAPTITSFAAQVIDPTDVLLTGALTDADPSSCTVFFSGAASGSVQADASGNFSLTAPISYLGEVDAQAIDGQALGSATAQAYINVRPPVLSANDTINSDGSLTVAGHVTAMSPAGLTVSFSGAANDSAVTDSAGDFSLTTTNWSGGTLTAQTVDNWGQWSNVVALNVNPITLTNPGNQTNYVGDPILLGLNASDASGGTLIYSESGLPPGLDTDPNNGFVYGVISDGADSGSPYTVTITASDGSYSASQTFQWTVSRLPSVDDQEFSVQENSPNGTLIGTVEASAPNPGQTIRFAITGGNTDDAFAIDSTTGDLTVANSAALVFADNPSFVLDVTVTDTVGNSASAEVTVYQTQFISDENNVIEVLNGLSDQNNNHLDRITNQDNNGYDKQFQTQVAALNGLLDDMQNALDRNNAAAFNTACASFTTGLQNLASILNGYLSAAGDTVNTSQQAWNQSQGDMFRIEGISADLQELDGYLADVMSDLAQLGVDAYGMSEVAWSSNIRMDVNGAINSLDTASNNLSIDWNNVNTRYQSIQTLLHSDVPAAADDQTITQLNTLYNQIETYFDDLDAPYGPYSACEAAAASLYAYLGQMQTDLQNNDSQSFASAEGNYETAIENLNMAIGGIWAFSNNILSSIQTAENSYQDDKFRAKGINNVLQNLEGSFVVEDGNVEEEVPFLQPVNAVLLDIYNQSLSVRSAANTAGIAYGDMDGCLTSLVIDGTDIQSLLDWANNLEL